MLIEGDLPVGADARDAPVDDAEAPDAQECAIGARDVEVAVDQQRCIEPVFRGETPVRFGVAVVDAVNGDAGGGVAVAVSTDRGELGLSTRCVVHRVKD